MSDINIDQILTQGQIASALLIIAVVLVYLAFVKRPTRSRH